jgi:hypothetical protein
VNVVRKIKVVKVVQVEVDRGGQGLA